MNIQHQSSELWNTIENWVRTAPLSDFLFVLALVSVGVFTLAWLGLMLFLSAL